MFTSTLGILSTATSLVAQETTRRGADLVIAQLADGIVGQGG